MPKDRENLVLALKMACDEMKSLGATADSPRTALERSLTALGKDVRDRVRKDALRTLEAYNVTDLDSLRICYVAQKRALESRTAPVMEAVVGKDRN